LNGLMMASIFFIWSAQPVHTACVACPRSFQAALGGRAEFLKREPGKLTLPFPDITYPCTSTDNAKPPNKRSSGSQ